MATPITFTHEALSKDKRVKKLPAKNAVMAFIAPTIHGIQVFATHKKQDPVFIGKLDMPEDYETTFAKFAEFVESKS